jgi:metal-dependent HD superfamily phosphatase/phosphodiesterase
MAFKVSTQGNRKLERLLEHVNADQELLQLWECANLNATERAGISDHGPVHIQIVANACVKLLRLLRDAGIQPSIAKDHGMTYEDAEVVVVLAACLHDIGIAVHRDNHESYSLILAYPKARYLLEGLYQEPELTKVVAEVLHAVIAHRWDVTCFSLEAGALKVADALDMTEGRSRMPFEAGEINIHSVSAQAVESVTIEHGDERPIRLNIQLNNSAGIFQVDELLKRKLTNSTLRPYIEVYAHLEGEKERRLLEIYRL